MRLDGGGYGRCQNFLQIGFIYLPFPHDFLEDIGKQFNVTRERIRQIEAKALKKIRLGEQSPLLKTFFGREPNSNPEMQSFDD